MGRGRGFAKLPCPECKAGVGENCYRTPGSYKMCCAARSLLFIKPKKFPVMARVHRIRGEGSNSCSNKRHASCSGTFNMKHGLGMKKCGCSCHVSES
jgi:hypothetical protein